MPAPSPSARVTEMVAGLSLEEKAALTAGVDFWSTLAVPRVGLPRVRVTDGPNGARGPWTRGEGGLGAVCVPCGTALGATWDPALVERVGALLGTEARRKACRVLLAPTVNIHRSPLAGRNFECYSEDPLLSGQAAAALVRGAQSRDVATTVKHLVANEAETERTSMSSEVDARTLREIYLVPFELAVTAGGSLGVMTSYNRLNGRWCTEDADLLGGILRDEWGFEGFVVTDWYGVTTTEVSPAAGVDLEMPGPARAYGPALAAAVDAGAVDEGDLDAQVTRMLSVFDRIGALDDTGEEEPTEADEPADRALAAEAAAAGTVLLTNDGTLPLDRTALRRVAVVGPNADRAVIMGGGSSHVAPAHLTTPLAALRAHLGPDVEVTHEPGVDITKAAVAVPGPVEAELSTGGEVVRTETWPTAQLVSFGPPDGLPADFEVLARTTYTPARTGPHTFTLVQAGRARVTVAGQVVVDGMAEPLPRGRSFMGFGSKEGSGTVDLVAGEPVEVVAEYTSEGADGVFGLRVGVRASLPDDALDRAVAAAAGAEVAVVVVGTDDEWESEGFDRRSMDLPGDQDELVHRVAAANPRTVVVLNAGAPVTMDWADEPAAVVQAWFGGQEMGPALARVLTGDAEPGGRLPTTIPVRLEHNPTFGTFPGDHDVHRYGEGVFVGYRWYQSRHLPVRFPFGHGLSYTTFAVGAPTLSAPSFTAGSTVEVTVEVTNTGDRAGSEVVQLYVRPPARTAVPRPAQELRAWAKVHLGPGESTTVTMALGDRAFAWWDVGDAARAEVHDRLPLRPPDDGAVVRPEGWRVDPGTYELRLGRSADAIDHRVALAVETAD
ncbi:glycoside hydrolase family 3 C-terminal domain-containing protein [Iamia majanohamensis]|uniref:Glycoside hydrolase family 3 C-terminal domain-containing protein n=1 Tax=Iamia majanohamensis TaxID=467976 RepID=A0AAE9Y9H9_9ACTN|nr:glycoside hydrolase family 3 C-terminal domain-containing protein [Iamia majanohamensis]WCO66824.1 glycoside hydrolase family 3 C-terminal domain-containing protein [Iamia majanohamensis]